MNNYKVLIQNQKLYLFGDLKGELRLLISLVG
jgi:hypothetical protein